MSLVVIGANHRSAPLDLLERMVIPGGRLPKFLHALDDADDVSEAVVLATCNRTEVYLVAEKFHAAYDQIRDFFSDLTFLPPDEFADSLYVHYDRLAVRHLFEVSAGLDSAVPGEHEILGQVRRAWETARNEGTSRRLMNMLFRHALEVGKRARSETRIAHHVTSVSQAAVILAGEHLADVGMEIDPEVSGSKCAGSVAASGLWGRRAVVVGAGSMAKGMASFVAAGAVDELVIANRSLGRAELLATMIAEESEGVTVRAVDLDALAVELVEADLLLTATGSEHPIVLAGHIVDSSGVRNRDLLVVDVGMPRDVDPSVAEIERVSVLDMESISALTEANLAARIAETDAVRVIVDDELDRFAAITQAREVAPVITDLRRRAEELREAELSRFSARLGDLDPDQLEAVEAMTRSMLAKLLHQPTIRLKEAAGSSRGDRLAESVRDLFDLD